MVVKIRTERPRKRGSIPDRGNRYFNSLKRLPIVNGNRNPSAHKHVVLYVSWNPYNVASHLKILIPVCTAMSQPSQSHPNSWLCEGCVDGLEVSFECNVQCIYNSL